MEVEAFDRVYEEFLAFHAEFAPHLGRKQWRERTREYLRGLLVQGEERRNAENVSEALGVSARSLQRVLTDARWDDAAVTVHLQAYLAPRLNHPNAVWAIDESGFVKQGKQSVGVSRQYCGTVGKVANCQIGVFLAHVGPRGRALVDKRLWLPQEWTDDPARCAAAGVPEEARDYQSKSELALALLRRAKTLGHLVAQWVTGDDAYGSSPEFRDAVGAEGFLFMLEVPSTTPVWPVAYVFETPPSSGRGRPPRLCRRLLGRRSTSRTGPRAPGSTAVPPSECAKAETDNRDRSTGWCIARTWMAANRVTSSPMRRKPPRCRRFRGCPPPVGRSRRSSRPRRAMWASTSMR